jgi:hypothetical protein
MLSPASNTMREIQIIAYVDIEGLANSIEDLNSMTNYVGVLTAHLTLYQISRWILQGFNDLNLLYNRNDQRKILRTTFMLP